MTGMMSGPDSKNCWAIAENRGSATPDGLQHLPSRARGTLTRSVMITVTWAVTARGSAVIPHALGMRTPIEFELPYQSAQPLA